MTNRIPTLALLALAILSSSSATAREPAPADDGLACAALRALDLSEAVGAPVKLREAARLPAGRDAPAVCRAAGTIAPKVGFDVRMPVEGWNGRLLVTGCTNLCGVIQVEGMVDALARGYATATTDMGHSEAEYPDTSWADNNLPLETDFGHRATHVTTLAAKEIVASYYGRMPEYSYFRGCSTGGRQGLVAANRYPDDYDGIIAGAPFNQSLSVPQMAWAYAANTAADGQPILKKKEFELLGRAALAACDEQDGLKDGIIGDPAACPFTPESLRCPEGVAAAAGSGTSHGTGPASARAECLTSGEVEAATKIYGGPRNSRGEKLASAGAPIGSELSWEQQLLAPDNGRSGKPAFFYYILQNWSRYLAYEPDPPSTSGPFTFDFDAGPGKLKFTSALVGFTPDLDRFRSLGGRLIVYHGWADESLMPAHTLDWWQQVLREQGGPAEVDRFARLYMVPGMLHCGGGPGAGAVDYLTALENWVEKDEAPGALTAFRTKDSAPTFVRQPRFPLPPGSVQFSRTVYPWPDVASYDGTGDPKSAASFRRR